MANQDADYGKLTDHEYDGIREYDNPCPTWWHLIFLGTFVFSVFYFLFFLGSFGWTTAEAYDSAVAENLKLRFKDIGELAGDEKTLLEYMGKPDWLAIGASVFQAQCKSCHGADGAGLVGPNLTDDNYKNIQHLADLVRVIENGASAGAMPAWKNRLHQNEIVLVAAYVANLRGKNIVGLGDPIEKRDGKYKPIPPWPTAVDPAPEPAHAEESAGAARPASADAASAVEPADHQEDEPAKEQVTAPKTDEPPTEAPATEKPAGLRENPLRQ